MDDIIRIRDELRSYFIHRDEEIDLCLTALLSGSNFLMIGPPGVAKSHLIRAVAEHFNARTFIWLLTKFTTPEEIFGPIDISELKKGRYWRRIEGKLPTAEIAFLDEIFKASSAILNSLLTIINERVFMNDTIEIRVPLISLFGASNTIPGDPSLQALYDRFLLRKIVDPLIMPEGWKKLLHLGDYTPETVVDVEKLHEMMARAREVSTDGVEDLMISIRAKIQNDGIAISDRRFRQSLDAVRAYAYIRGHKKATKDDLRVLEYIFWSKRDDIPAVRRELYTVIAPIYLQLMDYRDEINALKNAVAKINAPGAEALELYSGILSTMDTFTRRIEAYSNEEREEYREEIEAIMDDLRELKDHLARDILSLVK